MAGFGTASWTDKTLPASGWYPPQARTAEDRLRFYASKFPLAEVDATYYAPPAERTARQWRDRTPEHFTFSVKAFSLLTGHPTRVASLYSDLRARVPARASVYLRDVADEVVEEVTLEFLRRNDLAYVGVDMPQGHRSSVPPVLEATSDLAVVRFHGHSDKWDGSSVYDKFAYLYDEGELHWWAGGSGSRPPWRRRRTWCSTTAVPTIRSGTRSGWPESGFRPSSPLSSQVDNVHYVK